jgi:lipoprotein-anchoring transpeptidase ErfK/SrfK
MILKKIALILIALFWIAALGAVGLGTIIGLKQYAAWEKPGTGKEPAANFKKEIEAGAGLKKKLEALGPRGAYLVVDTGANRFYLKKGAEIIRSGLVSTGSGDILPDPSGKRQWIFDTPRGEFFVKSKVENPYWVKPDWAFIEEGEPIPKNKDDRVVGGELGDYALGFGNGFFLHGTLYTRLLGRNVTHGCVRIGDEDLKFLFKTATIGMKIYIY